jgi:tetratricopeptide (TPR) repeat protein
MFSMDESLDLLFLDAAKQVANSVRQPRESIVRLAHRRLENNARDVAAIHLIAVARIQNRQPERSLRLLRQHDSALENSATGHRLAGYAYLVQQDTIQARAHYQAAVRLDPRLHDCWKWLGRIDEQQGLLDQAAACFQRAMYFEDAKHESALELSRLFARSNRLNRAIATLRSVLRRDRRSARLNSALASLLLQRASMLRRKRKPQAEEAALRQARDCFQVAIAADPKPETYIALGRLAQRLGHFTEAASAFGKAVKINGNSPAAITLLANSAVESGDIDEALRLYRKALTIAPDFAPAHFKYSRAQRFKPGKSTTRYVQELSSLVANHDRLRHEQIQLNFALAKVLDDSGQYDRAWKHYDRANRLKPGHSENQIGDGSEAGNKSRSPLLEVVDDTIEFFTPELFAACRRVGNPSSTPIFIVGMPRSGTTLTEQIISSHREVAGAGELKAIERIRQQLANRSRRIPGTRYPQALLQFGQQTLTAIADKHVGYLQQLAGGANFVTDKMPTNFIHLGLIALLFPRATIIHCQRDPMDVLVSSYCQNLSAPFCDLEALAKYHQQYRRLMNHWQQVLPINIHTVSYESLVTDPEPHSRMLIESCGLAWDEQCLKFHDNKRSVHTPSKWQVRQPMYQSSVGKWKRFESHLQQIVDLVQQDDGDRMAAM